MVEAIINYALGPHGRVIADFYMKYQLPINSFVVAFGIYQAVVQRIRTANQDKSSTASKFEES